MYVLVFAVVVVCSCVVTFVVYCFTFGGIGLLLWDCCFVFVWLLGLLLCLFYLDLFVALL